MDATLAPQRVRAKLAVRKLSFHYGRFQALRFSNSFTPKAMLS